MHSSLATKAPHAGGIYRSWCLPLGALTGANPLIFQSSSTAVAISGTWPYPVDLLNREPVTVVIALALRDIDRRHGWGHVI